MNYYLILLIYLFYSAVCFSFPNILSSLTGGNNGDDYEDETVNKPKSNVPLCDETLIMKRLAKLYILGPEYVMMLVSDVDCSSLSKFIDITQENFKNCKPLDSSNLYMRLYKSLLIYFEHVCESMTMMQLISNSKTCLHGVKEELLDCAGPPDWYESTNHSRVCKILEDVLNCTYNNIGESCDFNLAKKLRVISVGVYKPVLSAQCDIMKIDSNLRKRFDIFNLTSNKLWKNRYKNILFTILGVSLMSIFFAACISALKHIRRNCCLFLMCLCLSMLFYVLYLTY